MTDRAAVAGSAPTAADALARCWLGFWFEPADPRPLAVVRMLTGLLGLALAASYAGELVAWFGPGGVIHPAAVAGWRQAAGFSPLDLVTSAAGLWTFFLALVAALAAVTVGLASRIACIAAALLWAGLLNRGPMLAGPADDCLALLLWSLAVGPCGASLSLDRLIRGRRDRPPASPGARASLGLLRVHATAITAGMLLAQLKGDVWWNGTAAWWLASGAEPPLAALAALCRRSEYLTNLITHGIVAFEILFALGPWFDATRAVACRTGLVAWPLVGLLAGEPLWGLAMAIFCVPWVGPAVPDNRFATPGARPPDVSPPRQPEE